ncbi:MAG: phosphoribosylanthranilate isomerase [Verrucomicrobiota bacterium]|nr:phosphoribosylanthranilate isomerase [Verrucomicrobiota bacterium]
MPVNVKVCGLTRSEDIATALALGVTYGGINRYDRSPRFVNRVQSRELLEYLPAGKRVVVDVMPSVPLLASYKHEGFDFFQIHFDPDMAADTIAEWSAEVSPERLWLAPKLPPEIMQFPRCLLALADTFVIDAFKKDAYGGTGQTADWQRFNAWQTQYPHKRWILAGGLGPDNVLAAINATGTEWVDLNSGVESAPGVKDTGKLGVVIEQIRGL